MKCPTWRAPIAFLSALLLWHISFVASFVVLFPALFLLAIPCRAARLYFEWWVSLVKVMFMATALLITRVALGVRTVIHCFGGLDQLQDRRTIRSSMLIISNHRTTVDFIWLWALALTLDRLRGLRIVLMDPLKHVPGFGWAMQCFGFVFVRRNLGTQHSGSGRNASNDMLGQTIQGACQGPRPLAVLLFPEGRDLNRRTVKSSNEFADKKGLKRYTQVLHPKTKGFVVTWESLNHGPPIQESLLVDATLAYVDHSPGEVPNPALMFLLGRCPREVHIFVEIMSMAKDSTSSETLCRELFAAKEERLCAWYARAGSDEEQSDPHAHFGCAQNVSAEATQSSSRTVLCSVITFLGLEAMAGWLTWLVGLRLSGLIVAIETLVFITLGICGGVDRFLQWHTHRWGRVPCSSRVPLL